MGAATADVMAGERAVIFRQAHWGLAAVVLSAFIFWLLTTYVGFWIAIVAAVVTVASVDILSVKLGWSSQDLERFVFLLGGSDGEPLFGP
jgi:uncharacterized membrane protein YeiH